MRPPTCERNLAGREEDTGGRVAYHPCGAHATWLLDPDGREWHACEVHALEAMLDGLDGTEVAS